MSVGHEDAKSVRATEGDIASLLENLRKPSEDKILFEGYLSEAWKIFRFDKEPNLVEFEAFLIAAISHCFAKADVDINEAKKKDACLVGLGLMSGCYHTKTVHGVPTNFPINERYESYLGGDYIALGSYDPKNDNLDIKDRKSKPRQALEQSDRRTREDLAKHLVSIASYDGLFQTIIAAGLKDYTYNEIDENGNTVHRIKLPKPYYTLEKFGKVEKVESPPEVVDDHGQGQSSNLIFTEQDSCGESEQSGKQELPNNGDGEKIDSTWLAPDTPEIVDVHEQVQTSEPPHIGQGDRDESEQSGEQEHPDNGDGEKTDSTQLGSDSSPDKPNKPPQKPSAQEQILRVGKIVLMLIVIGALFYFFTHYALVKETTTIIDGSEYEPTSTMTTERTTWCIIPIKDLE